MSSVFNEALERASNPKMPPPKSPIRTPTSPSRTSSMFQGKIKETVITIPGPSSSSKCRPSTPRPIPVEGHDIYASGALPPISFSPSNTATATGLPDEIPIPKFKTPSNLSYTSSYPEDEVDWSEPTPPLPLPLPPSHLDSGPCRNFRDPQAAADEERARHFAQHRQHRLQKLVSASDALRDARALPDAVGTETECDPLEALCEFDSSSHMVSGSFGSGTHMLAGEFGSVYVPDAWWSQSKASPAEDDLFSDVGEDGGDTDDDDDDEEEQWDAEFARAEEEAVDGDRKIGEGGYSFSYENGGLSTWRAERAATTSQGAGKDAAPISVPPAVATAAPYVKPKQVAVKNQQEGEDETRSPDRYGGSVDESIGRNVRKPQGATHVPTPDSGAAAAGPVAALHVKHTPLTTRDWSYPAAPAPSPTESQLLASGFEFHNELSEKEQIALFGDKAFRKALREVLPSLSRKQQWYAWRRVNEENYGESTASKEALKEEAKEDIGECECKCPGNGEECDGDDGTCGKLLSECLCGDCGDCDEHYLWHHPDGACETEEELGEPPEYTHVQRSVSGKGRREGGDGQTECLGQDCKCSKKRDHVNREADGERDTFTSDCGGGRDGTNCPCQPGRYACKDCWKSRAQHHRPALNPEVSDRPADWAGLFSYGRLVDGEPVSQVRQGLDVGHDIPAAPVSRIPGLGLLDQSSSVQPSHDQVRRSVEPEMPRRQMHRESTPAYENRSPSPSPIDRREDIEMTDAPSTTTLPPLESRLSLPQPTSSPDSISSPTHAVTAPETPARPRSRSRSRSRSPAKVPIPALETPKTTKRGGRRKSAVQGSKVEKTSTIKGRAVSRTVTTAVKNAAEKAGNKVKEAVARIEASVKAQDENTPRRSARIRAKMQREATPKE